MPRVGSRCGLAGTGTSVRDYVNEFLVTWPPGVSMCQQTASKKFAENPMLPEDTGRKTNNSYIEGSTARERESRREKARHKRGKKSEFSLRAVGSSDRDRNETMTADADQRRFDSHRPAMLRLLTSIRPREDSPLVELLQVVVQHYICSQKYVWEPQRTHVQLGLTAQLLHTKAFVKGTRPRLHILRQTSLNFQWLGLWARPRSQIPFG